MIPKPGPEGSQCTKIMGLHAAFGASHGFRCLQDVQPLEITQKKCLLLPKRKRFDRAVKRANGITQLQLLKRRGSIARDLLERIRNILPLMRRKPAEHARADRAPALQIADTVGKNAIEKRAPLLFRPAAVGT